MNPSSSTNVGEWVLVQVPTCKVRVDTDEALRSRFGAGRAVDDRSISALASALRRQAAKIIKS